MAVYVNKIVYAEHIVLIKGEVGNGKPVLVRMHALNVLDDVLSDASGKADELHKAMKMVADEGRGIIVLIREPLPTSLSDRVRKKMGEDISSNAELRDYGVGAQILLDLGVKDMILLSNTHRNIVGLEGYGLRVVEQRDIAS